MDFECKGDLRYNADRSSCECPAGSIPDEDGTSCTACPPNSATDNSNPNQCVCDDDYVELFSNGVQICKACPSPNAKGRFDFGPWAKGLTLTEFPDFSSCTDLSNITEFGMRSTRLGDDIADDVCGALSAFSGLIKLYLPNVFESSANFSCANCSLQSINIDSSNFADSPPSFEGLPSLQTVMCKRCRLRIVPSLINTGLNSGPSTGGLHLDSNYMYAFYTHAASPGYPILNLYGCPAKELAERKSCTLRR
jgi:hypothetical protein